MRSRNPHIHESKSSGQLGRSAENAPATASPRGEVESSRRARRAVRNGREAQQMSLDKPTPVEPSLLLDGEGCQGWTKVNPAPSGRDLNDWLSSHCHGGVGGHGMRAQVVGLRDEISGQALDGATAGASGQTARPVRWSEKSERSIVAMKAVTTPERRGRTWSKRTAKRRTRRWFQKWK